MLAVWRTRIIRLLGGYASIEAVPIDAYLAYVRSLPIAERSKLLTAAVRRLFNTVGPDDVLRIDNNKQWLWKGRVLNDGQIKMLQTEAKQFAESTLWKIISTEVVYQAQKRIYQQSEDIPDLVAGKLLIYYKDIVETRLRQML